MFELNCEHQVEWCEMEDTLIPRGTSHHLRIYCADIWTLYPKPPGKHLIYAGGKSCQCRRPFISGKQSKYIRNDNFHLYTDLVPNIDGNVLDDAIMKNTTSIYYLFFSNVQKMFRSISGLSEVYPSDRNPAMAGVCEVTRIYSEELPNVFGWGYPWFIISWTISGSKCSKSLYYHNYKIGFTMNLAVVSNAFLAIVEYLIQHNTTILIMIYHLFPWWLVL